MAYIILQYNIVHIIIIIIIICIINMFDWNVARRRYIAVRRRRGVWPDREMQLHGYIVGRIKLLFKCDLHSFEMYICMYNIYEHKKKPLLYLAYYTTARSHLLCIRASHPSDLWARKKPPVPLCTDYSIKRSENTSTPTRGR